MRVLSTLGVCLLCTQPVRALDLQSLWNFRDPVLSEQRFRAALASATTDEALILQTQIARSHGLRKDFEQARAVLMPLKPQLATASAEARTRWALEWGRSFASATHSQPSVDDKQQARVAYLDALASARTGALDGLAIDAIHMLAFVDTALAIQLRLERENAAAGTTDVYVYEELELLYRGQGDSAKAEHYAALRKAMK